MRAAADANSVRDEAPGPPRSGIRRIVQIAKKAHLTPLGKIPIVPPRHGNERLETTARHVRDDEQQTPVWIADPGRRSGNAAAGMDAGGYDLPATMRANRPRKQVESLAPLGPSASGYFFSDCRTGDSPRLRCCATSVLPLVPGQRGRLCLTDAPSCGENQALSA